MPRRSGSFDKECKTHGITSHYISSDKQERCRKCRNAGFTNRRKNLKVRAILYKGGSCIKCGYSECIEAMEFHHLDPKQKDSRIATSITSQTWDKIVIELDKCIMVCANCHRKIHSELLCAPKLADLLSEEATTARDLYNKAREDNPHRNIVWMPKAELELLLWKKPMIEIATDYGVSDKAIISWAKSYGLKRPPRGYWASKEKQHAKEARALEKTLVASSKIDVLIVPAKPTKPTSSELQSLLLSNPLYSISAKYGVSDSVIERWIKEFGLTKPPRNAWKKSTKQPE